MSLQSLTSRVRTELRDKARRFAATAEGDGQTTQFDLPVEYIKNDDTFLAQLEGAQSQVLVEGQDFDLDADAGKILMYGAPVDGTTLVVRGWSYRLFSDEEIQNFVVTATLQHVHGRVPPITIDMATPQINVPPIEEYLVVILAVIEALWVIATDSSKDIDVLTPDGVQIPRQQRYAAVSQLIQAREQQYEDLSRQLNVGLHAIQNLNLRRVSRTTSRLVPLYVAQEYDDHATPQRILPQIDTGLLN